MLEMKITIAIPDLVAALNNLAAALDGKNPHTICNQYGADNKHIDNVGNINMDMSGKAQPATPAAPVTTAPIANPVQMAPTAPVNPTPIPGVPLSATPAQSPAPINPAPVPTATPQYTLEMIAVAGSALIDAGKLDALMALLGKYGVDSLTNLDPSQYGAMATDLRALGARI